MTLQNFVTAIQSGSTVFHPTTDNHISYTYLTIKLKQASRILSQGKRWRRGCNCQIERKTDNFHPLIYYVTMTEL